MVDFVVKYAVCVLHHEGIENSHLTNGHGYGLIYGGVGCVNLLFKLTVLRPMPPWTTTSARGKGTREPMMTIAKDSPLM